MTEEQLREIIRTNSEGKLRHREGTKIEFKANFNFNSMNTYSKAMASFANRKGGAIIFGVTDSPRRPLGMQNQNFDYTDPERISNYLNQHFSPEINWHMFQYSIDDKAYGVLFTEESSNKPIICTRDTRKNTSLEGDIYYRYGGRSEKIKYPELKNLLEETRNMEKKFWAEHIEKISSIGPQNISLIDLKRGEISGSGNEKLIIDKHLIKQIKFIREGHFVESEGAPALKLIGNIEGVRTVSPEFDFEEDFYTTKELGKELDLLSPKGSTVYMTAVLNHFNVRDNPEYYKSNRGQKLYSKKCLKFLKSKDLDIAKAKELSRTERSKT
jgi:hypothetical protein